eukprot:TRINITY_DN3893_c0_g1_i1.p1 TRINITY_DN3893_c0_g1~~TRINITY_DN3893_c0_g1_i1.p1  ORF type:complete len:160 (+),score=49.38 TRINITY_DN3893_c0_g1_i1:69-548(+)
MDSSMRFVLRCLALSGVAAAHTAFLVPHGVSTAGVDAPRAGVATLSRGEHEVPEVFGEAGLCGRTAGTLMLGLLLGGAAAAAKAGVSAKASKVPRAAAKAAAAKPKKTAKPRASKSADKDAAPEKKADAPKKAAAPPKAAPKAKGGGGGNDVRGLLLGL